MTDQTQEPPNPPEPPPAAPEPPPDNTGWEMTEIREGRRPDESDFYAER